jgi:hypothetical protein
MASERAPRVVHSSPKETTHRTAKSTTQIAKPVPNGSEPAPRASVPARRVEPQKPRIPSRIESLPTEVIEIIFSYLPWYSLHVVTMSCRRLYEVVLYNAYLRYIYAPTGRPHISPPRGQHAMHHAIVGNLLVFTFGVFCPKAFIKYSLTFTPNPFEPDRWPTKLLITAGGVTRGNLARQSVLYPPLPRLLIHLDRMHAAFAPRPITVCAADNAAVTFEDVYRALRSWNRELVNSGAKAAIYGQASHYAFAGLRNRPGTLDEFEVLNGFAFEFGRGLSQGTGHWPPKPRDLCGTLSLPWGDQCASQYARYARYAGYTGGWRRPEWTPQVQRSRNGEYETVDITSAAYWG